VLKTDLAGGQLPSAQFGANAAWWALAVMAHNLNKKSVSPVTPSGQSYPNTTMRQRDPSCSVARRLKIETAAPIDNGQKRVAYAERP
jgi:hypothetical protein